MTIYHPRVGFEIVEVQSAGSNASDATPAPINVGETFLLIRRRDDWSSGQPHGGVALSGAGAADRVTYRIAINAGGVTLYLPPGDSPYGSGGRA